MKKICRNCIHYQGDYKRGRCTAADNITGVTVHGSEWCPHWREGVEMKYIPTTTEGVETRNPIAARMVSYNTNLYWYLNYPERLPEVVKQASSPGATLTIDGVTYTTEGPQ